MHTIIHKLKTMNKALALLFTGVAIGVLFAPDKGSVTRKKMEDICDDMLDKFSAKVEKWQGIAQRTRERIKGKTA
jgi:gas vesicle protein